jgi:hypothetical protein
VSSDGGSQLAWLWDAAVTGVLDVYNAWGWILPAILLTLLFCVVVVILCWILEDLPPEMEIVRTPFAIFRWTRRRWRETHWNNRKGTSGLVCLSLRDRG